MSQVLLLDGDVFADLFQAGAWENLRSEFSHAILYVSASDLLNACEALRTMGRSEVFVSGLNRFLDGESPLEILYPDGEILAAGIELLHSTSATQTFRASSVWLSALYCTLVNAGGDPKILTSTRQEFEGLIPDSALVEM